MSKVHEIQPRVVPGGKGPTPVNPPPALPLADPQGPQTSGPGGGFALGNYLQILLRRRWLILALTAVVVGVTTVQVYTMTPLYTAQATLQVESAKKILPYEDIGSSVGALSTEDLNTQIRRFKSWRITEKVAENLELSTHPAFVQPIRKGFFIDLGGRLKTAIQGRNPFGRKREAAGVGRVARTIASGVSITPVRGTRLLTVRYSAPDATVAADVTNALADEFILQNMASKYEATLKASEYLEKQLADLEGRIEDSQADVIDYARDKRLPIDSGQSAQQQQLSELIRRRAEAEAAMLDARARYQALRDASVAELPDNAKSDDLRSLERRLSQRRQELTARLGRYGPEWPAVRELRAEVADLEREFVARRGEAAEAARGELQLAQNLYWALDAQVRGQQAELADLDEAAIEFEMLKREADTNKQLYQGVLQRLREAGVAAGMQSNDITLVEPAKRPGSPRSPDKTRSILVSLALGLALGIASALTIEMLDNSVKNVDDITEQLGLPLLGVVPDIQARRLRPKGPFSRRAKLPQDRSPMLAYGEDSRMARRVQESYRAVRTSLLLSRAGREPRLILVTSALPAEGKSTTAANLAIALAQNNAATVLVDLDMRRPSLAPMFGCRNDLGISAFLAGNSDLTTQIHPTRFENLSIIPAGPIPPNPAELVGSERLRQGLEILRANYEFIVLDSPPALELSDSVILSRAAEGVVLVARAEETPKRALAQVHHRFSAAGVAVLGVILNGADARTSAYGYGYGYGYKAYDAYYGDPPSDRTTSA